MHLISQVEEETVRAHERIRIMFSPSDLLGQYVKEDFNCAGINRMVQNATTIAILVNEEDLVEPLAVDLNTRLEDLNLRAVACKDGKVVGNDRDVRVF